MMRLQAILNRDGGTFRTTDMDAYVAKAEEVFAAAGHELDCAVVAGDEMQDALEKTARRDDLDGMIAGGGDGTISSAAGVAWRQGMPLGIIPAGTMNLFARSLKVPLDIWQALDALAMARFRLPISAASMGAPSCTSFPPACTPAWCACATL